MEVDPAPAESSPPQAGKPVAIGKFDVVKNGKQVMVSRTHFRGTGPFAVLVLRKGANEVLTLGADVQGWFAWSLDAGEYEFRGMAIGYEKRILGMGGRFTIEEGDQTVYIGHFTVDLSAKQPKILFRDAEQDAVDETGKRYPHSPPPRKRLLESQGKIGSYSRARSACAKEWGVECSRSLQGVEPIHPAVARDLSGVKFARLDTVTPAFRWKPAPVPDVSYDVVLWKAAAYSVTEIMMEGFMPGQLIAYEEGLTAPEYTLRAPLEPKTKYLWSIRLRKGDTVSSWSRAGHSTYLVFVWSYSSGDWFGFETPE